MNWPPGSESTQERLLYVVRAQAGSPYDSLDAVARDIRAILGKGLAEFHAIFNCTLETRSVRDGLSYLRERLDLTLRAAADSDAPNDMPDHLVALRDIRRNIDALLEGSIEPMLELLKQGEQPRMVDIHHVSHRLTAFRTVSSRLLRGERLQRPDAFRVATEMVRGY